MPKKLKIVQAISHYAPAWSFGGTVQVAAALSRHMIRLGHSVTVCCTSQRDSTQNLDVQPDRKYQFDGADVYYELAGPLRRWGFSLHLGRRLKAEIESADFVFVHKHFQYASWRGAQIARRLKKPYFVFAHGSLRAGSVAARSPFKKLAYLRLLERRNLTMASRVIFNSDEEMCESYYADRGVVVPNGVAAELLELELGEGAWRHQHRDFASDAFVFLFLGRLHVHQKGLDLLLKAFAKVSSVWPSARLVMAGPADARDITWILETARNLGVERRLMLPGFVHGSDKVSLLRDADAFVLPSRGEGMSIALLEAMACGLPVIITDRCGGHVAIKTAGAGRVVSLCEERLAEAMLDLRDRTVGLRMSAEARRLVRDKYQWSRAAAQLECMMVDILASGDAKKG